MGAKQNLVEAVKQRLLRKGGHIQIGSGGPTVGTGPTPGDPGNAGGSSQYNGPGETTWLTGHGRPNQPPGVGEDIQYPAELKTAADMATGQRGWQDAHRHQAIVNLVLGRSTTVGAALPGTPAYERELARLAGGRAPVADRFRAAALAGHTASDQALAAGASWAQRMQAVRDAVAGVLPGGRGHALR